MKDEIETTILTYFPKCGKCGKPMIQIIDWLEDEITWHCAPCNYTEKYEKNRKGKTWVKEEQHR